MIVQQQITIILPPLRKYLLVATLQPPVTGLQPAGIFREGVYSVYQYVLVL